MALTKRQKQVLDFIAEFIEENGYSPSYEEIGAGLQLASLATVHKHISALEGKHYLSRGFNQSRSIEVSAKYLQEARRSRAATEPSGRTSLPLLGRIAAGMPVEAVEHRATLDFTDFTQQDSTYALEVRGDSMIEDHICSGDYVLVERTDKVRDGEIVVALVKGSEATLKRYYKEGNGRVRLQPANRTMEPIFVADRDLEIQGRLLAVLRKYR